MLRLAQSAIGRTEVTNDADGVTVTTWFSE
jgi:hypothetical protein